MIASQRNNCIFGEKKIFYFPRFCRFPERELHSRRTAVSFFFTKLQCYVFILISLIFVTVLVKQNLGIFRFIPSWLRKNVPTLFSKFFWGVIILNELLLSFIRNMIYMKSRIIRQRMSQYWDRLYKLRLFNIWTLQFIEKSSC